MADPARAIAAAEMLQQWAPVAWLRTSVYAYPTLEVLHILGIALLFGTVWIVDLRLLGTIRKGNLHELARLLLPWTLAGFVLAAFTGLLMFTTRASDLIANGAFVVKMGLLFAAGCNAALLHARGPLDDCNTVTRLQALLSVALWIAVVFCGRWIAYV